MSAETASSINTVEIFVPLLNEGTSVLRPATGRLLNSDVIQILPTSDYDPAVEEWEFPPGSNVMCVTEMRGGRSVLVARHLAG